MHTPKNDTQHTPAFTPHPLGFWRIAGSGFQTSFLCSFFCLLAAAAPAKEPGTLSGTVQFAHGGIAENVAVQLTPPGHTTRTDADGNFEFTDIAARTYRVHVAVKGYRTTPDSITVQAATTTRARLFIEPAIHTLSKLTVEADASARIKKQSGFTVDIIDAAAQKNTTQGVNEMLKGTAGIHIRQSGGMGSTASLSLNGLTGNQIRFFVDGIALQDFGTALNIENYPPNLIESVEVYKGVVPVSLSSDALGGAIHITTAPPDRSLFDASYTTGSFSSVKEFCFGAAPSSCNSKSKRTVATPATKTKTFILHPEHLLVWAWEVPVGKSRQCEL